MNERRAWLATTLLALGAGALAFAALPGRWPNPLAEGDAIAPAALRELAAAAAAVDAACARGDGDAFAATTTASHRQRLTRHLAAVDGVLDGGTLQALGNEAGRVDWLAQPVLAGHVRGDRAAVAVARPEGDGCQLLVFVWDGRGMRFDGGRHLPTVRSRAEADAVVAEAVLPPGR